eukprot:jgi/Hompol1/1375/HPOL_003609-RA
MLISALGIAAAALMQGVLAATTTSKHEIKVIIVVDDFYNLTINGQKFVGPTDTNSWSQVKSYTTTVDGNGPWLLSVQGQDIGTIAGLFAAVYLDGSLYTATGTATNKFVMTPDAPSDPSWQTSISFNDSKWLAQTKDACAGFSDASGWNSMLPTLDSMVGAMTPGLKARAMWPVNCKNTGSYASPRNAYFRLNIVAPQPAPVQQDTHELKIVMTTDNYYDLTVDGQTFNGPLDSNTNGYGWQQIKTYTKTVSGSGPWLIAAHAKDYGVIAGLFAAVYLDGVPYTATGGSNNKFVMTLNTPAETGWDSDVNYDDGAWTAQLSDGCPYSDAGQWGSLTSKLDSMTPGLKARAMWMPDCKNVGSNSKPLDAYFRLTVQKPTVATIGQGQPHELKVIVLADNHYDIYINGQKTIGPYDIVGGKWAWQQITTHTATVYGDGPWTVAADVRDYGGVAGFFAAVSLDGKPITETGGANNKFRVSTTKPATIDWTSSSSFDDSAWAVPTQFGGTCADHSANSEWKSLITTMAAMTPGQTPRPLWLPDCSNVGSFQKPLHMYFRLRLDENASDAVQTSKVIDEELLENIALGVAGADV